MFKSDKQASFLLGQCDSNKQYHSTSSASFGFGDDGVVNKQYDVIVQCDSMGVVFIIHIGGKTRKERVFFERLSETALAEKQAIKAQEWVEYEASQTKARSRMFKHALYNKQLDKLCRVAMTKHYRTNKAFADRVDSIYLKIKAKLDCL
jgi:hypothetical protein